MKINQHLFSLVMLLLFFSSFIFSTKSLATSWAYPFVVWEDYIYVVSDEYVTEIDTEIGHVTMYSDMKSYPGNFSNAFKKGTKYYSIKGISTEESLAIEESDGRYLKADRDGKYEVKSSFYGFFYGQQGIFVYLILGILAIIFIIKVIKNKPGS
ncbi:hypothetical protein [Neobacillus niacini]|uniref:hypothetical protein n=1 Tax=Neobacillus niacini TaxID=86668 RepID=UPI0005EE0A03|nr:hypothetical protein [Neobacillus niacini]